MLTIELLSSFIRHSLTKSNLPFSSIILFGSVARGKFDVHSDIDLICILKQGVPISMSVIKRLGLFEQSLRKKFLTQVSLNVMTVKEFYYLYTPLFYADLSIHAIEIYGSRLRPLLNRVTAKRISRKHKDLIAARRILFPIFLTRKKFIERTGRNSYRECRRRAEHMLKDLYFIASGEMINDLESAKRKPITRHLKIWNRCLDRLPSSKVPLERYFVFFDKVFSEAIKILKTKYGASFVLPMHF